MQWRIFSTFPEGVGRIFPLKTAAYSLGKKFFLNFNENPLLLKKMYIIYHKKRFGEVGVYCVNTSPLLLKLVVKSA